MESSFWRDAKTSTRDACAAGADWECIFRRGRCCGVRGLRISHTTAVINAVGRALSKRLEREKARIN